MNHSVNIDFNNSSSIPLGYQPNIVGTVTNDFAYSTHIHGSILGINITANSASNGLTLSVADPSVAANVVLAGDNISLSTDGASTTVSVIGLGDYALSWHSHGTDDPSQYISLDQSTLYMTSVLANTFEQTGHTHAYAGGGFVSGSTSAGTAIVATNDSNGLSMVYPKYLTTAADISHTHGNFVGQNITLVGSASNGLTLSVANAIPLANSTQYNITYLSQTFANTSITSKFIQSWKLEGTHTAGTVGSLQGSILYLQGGDNVTLSGNSNTIIISAAGGAGGLAGIGNTASSNAFTSGSIMFSAISNITVNTSVDGASQYIRLSVADPAVAANSVYTVGGGYMSLSIDGISTTVSATGLQPTASMSNYIAQSQSGVLSFSNNSLISFGTTISGSSTTVSGSYATSLFIPAASIGNFFLDAASTLLQPVANSTLSLGVGYSTHTHSDGGNVHTHGTPVTTIFSNSTQTNIEFTSASSGLTMRVPAFLTTAAASTHGHGSVSIVAGGIGGTLSYTGLNLSIPNYLLTAAQVSHTHGNISLSLNSLSGTYSSASNGLTISLTAINSSNFIITSQSGSLYFQDLNGITWGSTNSSNSTTIFVSSMVGGGGGGVGVAGSAASTVTNGIVQFSNANGASFGLNGSTMTLNYTVPSGSVQFVDNGAHSFSTSVGTGTASIVTYVWIA